MMQTTAIEIAHDAFVNTSEAIDYHLDHDMVTAILTFGDQFFALSDEYDDGEFLGYSWAWGTDIDGIIDCFGEDGSTTFGDLHGAAGWTASGAESEARAAVAEWIATVTK